MGLHLPKRARNVVVGGLTGAALLFLTGCSADGKNELERLAMPDPATVEGDHIYTLWQWSWLAAMITGVIVWGLIFYAMIKFRRRSENEIPVQTRYNLPIEIFYTLAPVMMVVVFFYATVEAQNASLVDKDKSLAEANALADQTVTVVGQQWSWTFNYTDVDALGGATVYEGGTTADRPTLWLVEGKKVSIDLYSPDVIHSFWVPAFLFKMDVVPGREKDNHFSLTPNREGTFEGRCAELCGLYHSRMLFEVKVTDQASFDAHMKDLQEEGNTGLALGGSEVSKQPGLESNGGEE